VDKTTDPRGPYAICPACQHRHSFRQLPLLIVCGPSTSGKSTVCQQLIGTVEEAVLLDSDILWRHEFNKPDDHYRDFFETWLRMGINIGQSGRPLVLFGSGLIPDNIEPCTERRYFAEVYYLALTCDDETLEKRLKQRPLWRQCHDEQFVAEQIKFNRWIRAQSGKTAARITLLDTTHEPIHSTVEQVGRWIRARV
jgi:hypothetical protein